MTTKPTLKVEIAFGSSPLANIMGSGSPTWTDVSTYVRSGSVTRGRSTELDTFSAGSCSVVLDNRTRRFDPSHTTGPYYGSIIPRCPIRITATWAGTDYPLFYGFVSAWPQDRTTDDRDFTVTVQAVDGLAYLATIGLNEDLYSSYVDSLSPTAVWPLGDDGVTQIETVDQKNFTMTAAPAHTDAPCATYIKRAPSTFDGTLFGLSGPGVNTSTFSIIAWFRTVTANTGLLGTAGATRLYVDGFGLAHYTTTGAAVVYSSAAVTDGTSKMIVLTHDATSGVTTPQMYVNGTDLSLGATAGATGTALWQALGDTTTESPFVGPIQHVAIVPKIMSSLEVFYAYYFATTGLDGYSASFQIGAVLDCALWPTAWRTLDAGTYTLDFVDTASGSALDVIAKIVASEQGLFFVDRNGYANFIPALGLYDSTTRPRSATSQFTLADNADATKVPYVDSGFDLDDSFIANEVIVTTGGGEQVVVRNSASITKYGKRSVQIDTRLRNVTDAQSIANARVARYATPSPRLRSFRVMPQRNPSVAFPKMLGVEVADRVTVRSQPTRSGSITNADYWVEGIHHEWDAQTWTCAVSASQVPGGGYWTLDTSPLDGVSTRLG